MSDQTVMVYLKIYHPNTYFEGHVPVDRLVAYAAFMASCIEPPPKPSPLPASAISAVPEQIAPEPVIKPNPVAEKYVQFRAEMDAEKPKTDEIQ